MSNTKGQVHNFRQWGQEEQLRSFLAWLPQDLQNAPGINWAHLPDTIMRYCIKNISTSPDASYLAIAAASAQGNVSSDSLLQMLRHLHAFLRTMRASCGMEHMSDLGRRTLWDAFATRTSASSVRSKQLSSYSAVSMRHYPQYLHTLDPADTVMMQQYQLPCMPPGFLRRVGKASELNASSKMRQQPIHQQLVPLFPVLCQLVWLRKQLAERLLQAYHQAQRQAAAGAVLPLHFQYTDILPWVEQQGQTADLHQRELQLRFILWSRRSWVLHHQERYSRKVIRRAQRAYGPYSPEQDRYFVQFDGSQEDLLWIGELVEQQLLQHLYAGEARREPTYAERVRLARELGFPRGCPGILRGDTYWFAQATRRGDQVFDPEPLYRGVLYGAALAMLAMASGGSTSELLQVSADRWVTTPVGRHQKLLPERAKNDQERRLFTISAEAAQLLQEIGQRLVEAYAEIPVVPASRQITKFDQLRPERYYFQWQRGMVDPHDTETLVRFLLHGVSLFTPDRQPIRFSMELLRGGNVSLEERSQTLLHVLGFNQGILLHLSPASADVYCRDLFAYWQFAGSKEAALQPLTLARWMVHMREERYDVSTINRMAREIRRIFAAAAAAGHIDRSLADAFQQVGRISLPSTEWGNSIPHLTYARIYKKCGNPSCSVCRDGKGHGPYWYAYWRENGKRHTVYVGPEKDEHALAVALRKIEQLRGRNGTALAQQD
jgi:hypothetical protein